MKQFQVKVNACNFGIIGAASAKSARNIAARIAGYKSEADMSARLGQPSQIEAVEVFGE